MPLFHFSGLCFLQLVCVPVWWRCQGQNGVTVGIAAVVVAAVEVVVEEKVQVEVLDLEGMEDLVVELVGVELEEVE